MTELADYLMKHYYAKYYGQRTDVIPTADQIERGLANHEDKIIIIRDDKIKGVAIFITLTDETYAKLKKIDVTDFDILCGLLREHGEHIHFVLLAADGYRTIMSGINKIKRKYKPKTISWWNPDLTYLHQYKTGV